MDITFSDLEDDLPIIEEDDSWFYENIQAPKFVDFCAPDSLPIDDRSWFCLRFGCDQQHDELELDPEALHRDFMLRVMAARSPNVKLQRSLNKRHQSPGSIKKCPHSAPAKSVKGGRDGTNSISSIPNYSNSKLKSHPVSSLKSTPSTKEEKVKTLMSEKKALMSPRSKRLPAKYVPSKSAKIPNGKVESLNHKDASKASCRSSSISKRGDICDGTKKLSIDSIMQHKKSMTVKKKIEAVSTQGDDCKAVIKVGVKPSRSAKIGNGKVESSKHNGAAKASFISNSTSKYNDICDGMKKLSIDSIKKNKRCSSVKKKTEAVSIPGEACKAIIKVGVEHRFVDDIVPTISKVSNQSDISEEFLKVKEVVPQVSKLDNSAECDDDICDGMKKLSIDSIKKNKKCMTVKKKTEAVSIQVEACKAIIKEEVEHKFVGDIVPTISKEFNWSDVSEEFLKVNEVVPHMSKLDNSAEYDDGKENACTTRCKKISTTNSESSENSQQKENKAPIRKIKEATFKGKVKRSTDPKPFRLRTDERRIVKEANAERKVQAKSQKENLTTLRHGDIKNRYANGVKNHKITLGGPKDNTSKHAIDERKLRVLEGTKDDKPKYVFTGKQHKTTSEGPKDNKSNHVINGKNHRTTSEGPKDDNSKHVINGKIHGTTSEGPKDDKSKYVNNGKTHRRILEGPKDSKHEKLMVKEANAKSNIQLKTQKKVPTPLKHNGDVRNQNAIHGMNRKSTVEVPKTKPNLPKAPRVRFVESRFGKSTPNIHNKLQPETKETTNAIQNKVIKKGSSIPNTQRVSNVRKTVISQAKVVERNSTMANAACLKGKRPSVTTNRETKFANS